MNQKNLSLMAAVTLAALTGPVQSSAQVDAGIQVNGDWEITIHDTDGTPLRTVNFRNRFDGQFALVRMLSGHGSVSKERIRSGSTHGEAPWDIWFRAEGLVDDDGECTRLQGTFDTNDAHAENPANATLEAENESFSISRQFSIPASCITGTEYSITQVLGMLGWNWPGSVGGGKPTHYFSSKQIFNVTGILPDQVVTMKVNYSFQ